MSEPLWRWPALCEALNLPVTEGPDVTGISIDSRSIQPGDLFIALTGDPGPRFNVSHRSERDGHEFIEAALANGAAGVLTHDAAARDCPELKVQDTLDALWALGRAARGRLNCPVIAITGSSGKTTTKTFLAAALGAFATEGSLNNHLGVPLSLARTPADSTAAVFEVGTNHPGEIGPLSELVAPTVSVLLNVHQAHAENFPDRDALVQEKLSIINGLRDKSPFVVEDTLPLEGIRNLQIIPFGRSPEARVQFLDINAGRARYRVDGRELTASVPGGGEHRALSLAAVIGVFLALGRDPAPALSLSDALVPGGRGNRQELNGLTLIDDSYNANPSSMAAALTTLTGEPGQRIALLGEMLELGAVSAAAHADLAPLCADLDGVYLVGEGMRPLAEALGDRAHWSASADDNLLETLTDRLKPGDTLLVKGSNRVFWARGFVSKLIERLTS